MSHVNENEKKIIKIKKKKKTETIVWRYGE